VFKFVIIKFTALGLSSVRSLLLAAFLGPASYGAFGVLILIQQYLSYATLGMREGLTVSLAKSLNAPNEVDRICISALTWGAGVGFVVAICIVALYAVGLLGSHLLLVGVISFFSILNEMLININRAQEKLRKIALIELLYNSMPLLALLYFWKTITIPEILFSLAAGLFLSVVIYLWTMPGVRGMRASWSTTKHLLGIGLPLSVQSALIFAVNSVFIVLANRLYQGAELGIVVFAANICTLIMFALNAVAWAATSRSMSMLYGREVSRTENLRAHRMRNAFRVGILGAVIIAMSTSLVLRWVLVAYSGADEYILYFVLFQAYGILLFDELNYLAVNGRNRLVIAAYASLLLMTIGPVYVLPFLTFANIAKLGIVFHFALAVAVTAHCNELRGMQGMDAGSKFAFLMFPIACMLLYSAAGHAGVALACGLAVPAVLRECFMTRRQHA
jgi:O-antigen/teichoic acid export membrane protein